MTCKAENDGNGYTRCKECDTVYPEFYHRCRHPLGSWTLGWWVIAAAWAAYFLAVALFWPAK